MPKGKKNYLWLILPFIVIIILVIIRLNHPKKASSDSDKVEDVQNQRDLPPPTASSVYYNSKTAIFSPDAIIDMVDKNEDYIAGICSKNDFKYSAESENSVYKYKYSIYDGNWVLHEQITTWRDHPNRLNYCIHDESKYLNFISEINKLNPVLLKKNQYDKDYPDSSHLLVKECAFIPIGYKKDFEGYCIIVIRKDKLNSSGKTNSDVTGNDSDPNTFIVKSDVADIYESPSIYHKTTMSINRGKKVAYIETDGQFIKCKYTNDEGVPIEGYILVNDVGRMR